MQNSLKKIFVIDGYNVLRSNNIYKNLVGIAPDFKDWNYEFLNLAREELLKDVLKITDKNSRAIIVYDASNKSKDYVETFSNNKVKSVEIIFSKHNQTADDVIQSLVYKFRNQEIYTIVVSDDYLIQFTTINKNVSRMSTKEFCEYIKDESFELQNFNKQNISNKFKTTIESVLDKETVSSLKSLRDSL